jgi:hypothetical protein
MKQHISQTLYAYWNEVRGNRLAPKRFEIEPSCLAEILPDTFILERIDPQTARFRLAGTRICEAFGVEFRGANFFEMFAPEDRAALQRQFSAIAGQGAAGLFTIDASTEAGHSARFEITVLPLIHTRDVIDRFLGSVAPAKAETWFGSETIVTLRLAASELIWPEGRPHAIIENAHHQAPFQPYVRSARIVRSDRRQFRVYDGGRTSPDDDR